MQSLSSDREYVQPDETSSLKRQKQISKDTLHINAYKEKQGLDFGDYN